MARVLKPRISDRRAKQFWLTVGTHDGQVTLDLGTAVKWFSLPPPTARALARVLLEQASALDSVPSPDESPLGGR